jgi:lipoyl(octanoyl) transferase
MEKRLNVRVLNSGFKDGYYNMALDEALFTCAAEGASPPTLRFYGWKPAAVSLGYFQDEGDFSRMPGVSGMDIVKRLTGGGAIVHDNELTFSIVCGEKEGLLPEDVFESYEFVCRAVEAGLGVLGIEACARGVSAPGNPVSGPGRKSPYYCFEKPSRFDVVAVGEKVAGSAQRRRSGAILHHGSVPFERVNSALRESPPPDGGVSFDALRQALLEGFKQTAGCGFVEGGLKAAEEELAGSLMKLKYRNRGVA